jgi:hypothetical protein
MTIPPEPPSSNGHTNGHSYDPPPEREPTSPGRVDILHEPIYERQPSETRQAYAAFSLYRDLPPNARSVERAYDLHRASPGTAQNPGRSPVLASDTRARTRRAPGTWSNWCVNWRWVDRAQEWDRHLDHLSREAAEEQARLEGVRIAQAQAAQRERELEFGQLLMVRAREMLVLPAVEQVVEQRDADGRPLMVRLQATPRWSFRDAAKAVEVAMLMQRLALDMETSRSQVTVDMEDEVRRLADQYGFDQQVAVELVRDMEDTARRSG